MNGLWFVRAGLVLLIVVVIGFCCGAVRERRRLNTLWEHGRTAQALVTESWSVRNPEDTTVCYAYEFTADGGRTVGFEENSEDLARQVGDEVCVYYLPEAPERATAMQPSEGEGRAAIGFAAAMVTVVFLGWTLTWAW